MVLRIQMLFRNAGKDEMSEEEDDDGSEAGPARTMKVGNWFQFSRSGFTEKSDV